MLQALSSAVLKERETERKKRWRREGGVMLKPVCKFAVGQIQATVQAFEVN